MRTCPKCHGPSRVTNTRDALDTIYRRRECKACGERWSTHEVMLTPATAAAHSRGFRTDPATSAAEKKLAAIKRIVGEVSQ